MRGIIIVYTTICSDLDVCSCQKGRLFVGAAPTLCVLFRMNLCLPNTNRTRSSSPFRVELGDILFIPYFASQQCETRKRFRFSPFLPPTRHFRTTAMRLIFIPFGLNFAFAVHCSTTSTRESSFVFSWQTELDTLRLPKAAHTTWTTRADVWCTYRTKRTHSSRITRQEIQISR